MHKLWYELPMPENLKEALKSDFELIGPLENPDSGDRLSGIEEADWAFIGANFPAREDVTFERANKIKAFARLGIGYDNVDLTLATKHGVCILNTPDAPTEGTAELAMAMILGLARPILKWNRILVSGGWDRSAMGVELEGKILGIIGLGRIGSRLAELAGAFGMKILAYDPFVDGEKGSETGLERVNRLEELYRQSDFVTLHTPLLPETRGMINARSLALMKRGSFFINVSRGPLVVEADLYEALAKGHLGGAGIDVWDPEPPAADNPLLKMDNVLATPHMGGLCREMIQKGVETSLEGFRQLLRDEKPQRLLNPEVWEKRRRE